MHVAHAARVADALTRPPANTELLLHYVCTRRSSSGRSMPSVEDCHMLDSLLKSVRLLRDPVTSSKILQLTSHQNGTSLGKLSLGELVAHAARLAEAHAPPRNSQHHLPTSALNANAAREALAQPAWNLLRREIGDLEMLKLLVGHYLFLEIAPERWLQLTGRYDAGMLGGWAGKRTRPKENLTKLQRNRRKKRRRLSQQDRDDNYAPTSLLAQNPPMQPDHFLEANADQHRQADMFCQSRYSKMLVPLHRIFFAPHFSCRCGLPKKHVLAAQPPSARGARVLLEWILSPALSINSTDARGGMQLMPHRNSGKIDCMTLASLLLEPIRNVIANYKRQNFMDLLAHHCPSGSAIESIAAFENTQLRQNYQRGADNLRFDGQAAVASQIRRRSVVLGRLCACSFPASSACEQAAALPREAVCEGGVLEIHFMRKFPTLQCCVPIKRVMSFVVSALNTIFGQHGGAQIFGSVRNWRCILKAAETLVQLRRGEIMTAHDALHGLSRNDFTNSLMRRPGAFQASRVDMRCRDELLARLAFFVLAHVVVPLLRECFYVTDTEVTGTRAVFFRKNVWHLIRSRADCAYQHLSLTSQGKNFEKSTSPAKGGDKLRSSERKRKRICPPGLRPVRWVPKKQGLRPIISFSRQQASSNKKTNEVCSLPPPKRAQRTAMQVLSFIRSAEPGMFGCSVLSHHEVHRPLRDGLKRLLDAGNRETKDSFSIYVAAADLKNCYEHIDHAALFRQVMSMPLARSYNLEDLLVYQLPSSSVCINSRDRSENNGTSKSSGERLCRKIRAALPHDFSGGLPGFLLSPHCPPSCRRPRLLLMPASRDTVRGTAILNTIQSTLSTYGVLLGTQRGKRSASGDMRELMLQRGIPQGSSLSPLLCGLRMGEGDAKAISAGVLDADVCFLIRLVDDFLLISSDSSAVERFLNMLAKPQNPYGGNLNTEKIVASFPLRRFDEWESPPVQKRDHQDSVGTIPWAGLTLSPESKLLNVSAQVVRAGGCVADMLSVRRNKNTLRRRGEVSLWHSLVETKLHRFLDLKLTCLVLDPTFNSRDCIHANIARVCGLCGLRLCWLVMRRLPPHASITPAPRDAARVAIRLAHHAARLVAKRCVQNVESAGHKEAVGEAVTTTWSGVLDEMTASRLPPPRAHRDTEVLCLCLEALQSAVRSRRRHAVLGTVYRTLGLKRARLKRASKQ